MKINQNVVNLLNAKNTDLQVKLGIFKNLKNLKKVLGEELPSLDQFAHEFEAHLKKVLNVNSSESGDIIAEFTVAQQKVEYEVKHFLMFDTSTGMLKKVGAKDSTIEELASVKEALQKRVFNALSITDEDLKEINGGTNE
jgi:hypothetical protein